MNCFFWNTEHKNINTYLVEAIKHFDIDVIALAEYADSKDDLLLKLNEENINFFHVPIIACRRINIFTKYNPDTIEHMSESSYYTIKRIPHYNVGFINFVFIHFPSKLYMDDFDFLEESREFRMEIEEAEDLCGSNFTLIIGDFNMNPFEHGLMAASTLHAYPTVQEAMRESRIIKGRSYKMFHNPMWNFFGDMRPPKGTYYYSGGSHHYQFYWNIFDQLLYRPSLIPHIAHERIEIIHQINGISLVNERGIPSVSDHLPIFFNIT